jgi:flagellin-like protein
MKGISDIIAMLLMLVITIAIAGLAYGFISGVFTGRTAVVLSIDGASTFCNSSHIVAYVRNDGTATSGTVTVTVYNSTGVVNSASCPTTIASGVTVACAVSRDGSGIGTHTITATAAGASTARATVYCAS